MFNRRFFYDMTDGAQLLSRTTCGAGGSPNGGNGGNGGYYANVTSESGPGVAGGSGYITLTFN